MKAPYAASLAGSIWLLLATIATAAPASGPVCVLVPHFKDEYWLSVGYGLEQEAAAMGVTLWLREAGGYRAREHQIAQIRDCVDAGASAVLIGAVSSDHPALLDAVAQAASKVPVFGLVNDLKSDALSGAVGVDWADMGRAVGDELSRLWPQGGAAKRAVLISGPSEAGWTEPVERGLRETMAASSVTITAVYSADTSLREQFAQVSAALAGDPGIDILIGSAPAVESAIGWLAAHDDSHDDAPHPALISTYISHSVWRGLMNGTVAFAPFDDPEEQGRMALRMVTTFAHDGQKRAMTGPKVLPLRPGSPLLPYIRLSPADYFPKLE